MIAAATSEAAAQAEPLPSFDFTDCPAIPAKADPSTWRCEVLISHGTIRIGQSTLSITNLRTVFAEGRLDGHYTQVFGSMAADPNRLKGIPVDVGLGYAG